jgi:hypothetical protein
MADYGTRNSTKKACRMVFCTLQAKMSDPAANVAPLALGMFTTPAPEA